MNKELLEKLTAIREDLVAFQANVGDVKKLAELVNQKGSAMERNYKELRPYMTLAQGVRANDGLVTLNTFAQLYPERSENHEFTDLFAELATTEICRMIDDLDVLEATVRWLGSIADHMGCPLSELLRYQPTHPWFHGLRN